MGKKKTENKANNVTRSNSLIEARYESTLIENKLLALSLKEVVKDDYGRPSVSFTTDYLRSLMGVSGNGLYLTLKRAADHLTDMKVFIENKEKKEFAYFNLVHSCSFQQGKFQVCFTPETNEMLYDLKGNFTTMSIETLFTFQNNYSYRLYELLKVHFYQLDNQKKFRVIYNLSDFKLQMNCVNTRTKKIEDELRKKNPDTDKIVNEMATEKKYDSWGEFRRRVVDKAVEELNKNPKVEFEVSYKPLKGGRGGKVHGIEFTIYKKAAVVDNENRISIQEVLDIIAPTNISDADALAIINVADGDIQKIIDAYELAKKQIYIDNLVAWLIAAIKNEYKDESIAMSTGDTEKGEALKEVKRNMSDPDHMRQIAEEVWEKTKKTEGFQEFITFVELNGIDFRMFEMLEDADTKYKKYIDWRLKINK